MKITGLLTVVVALAIAGVAHAQTTVWNPAGNGIYDPNDPAYDPNDPAVYDPNSPQDWGADGNNWTGGVIPTLSNKVVFNVDGAAEAQVTDAQFAGQLVQGDGQNTGGVIRVVSGGTLSTGPLWSAIGYNRPSQLIVETGGVMNTGGHLWVGFLPAGTFNDSSIVDVDGGTLTVGDGPDDALGLNWESDSFGDGNDPIMNVINGGVVNAVGRLDLGHTDGGGTVNINSGGTVNFRHMRNDGTIVVGSGGQMISTEDTWNSIGERGTSEDGGTVTVESGGSASFASHLWVGWGTDPNAFYEAKGTVNVDGGTVSVGGMLGLGWDGADPNTDGTGLGFINVNSGGVLDLAQLHSDGESSIEGASLIDISGSGEIHLPGNLTAVVTDYVNNGKIVGDGGSGDVLDVNIAVSPIIGGPGDFNSDGIVDGLDFLDWQINPNIGLLADWEANYGTSPMITIVTAASLAAITSVPEPGTVVLLLSSLLVLSGSRRRVG